MATHGQAYPQLLEFEDEQTCLLHPPHWAHEATVHPQRTYNHVFPQGGLQLL